MSKNGEKGKLIENALKGQQTEISISLLARNGAVCGLISLGDGDTRGTGRRGSWWLEGKDKRCSENLCHNIRRFRLSPASSKSHHTASPSSTAFVIAQPRRRAQPPSVTLNDLIILSHTRPLHLSVLTENIPPQDICSRGYVARWTKVGFHLLFRRSILDE